MMSNKWSVCFRIDTKIGICFDSGDVDVVVPVTSTRYSINSLRLPVNVAWRPWYSQNEVLKNNNTHFHSPTSSMGLQRPQFCLSIGNLFFSQNWMHSITSPSHSCIKENTWTLI